MVGRTILHYQLLEKLGSGGMGEIFRAQDTRLNRFVAIKVLTSAAAGDPERRRRFIQEAQAASALNHPNIIVIHDILSVGGTEFMVMEYVTGKTLVDLIPKGGLRVSQVLKYSVQMANALQVAHNAGIVHRDLKPGNVMVTDSGLVKILDFGLAKLTDRGPISALSNTDMTQTIGDAPLTVEGSIIGTVSYMSPEQAQGKKVDTRSDIFSFGVVLYEMVTGARAFHGDSALTTLSSILRDEVRPVADFAPEAPPQLEMVIRRCLKKLPDERWQTMQDVEMALAALKHESDSGSLYRPRLTAQIPAPPPKKKLLPTAVLVSVLSGTLVLGAIGGGVWWAKHRKPAAVETSVEAPEPPQPAPAPDAVPAPAPSNPDAADEPMTNDIVVQMVAANVSANQIIAQIRASKNTNFVLTPAELIRLAKAGVRDDIVEAMRNPKRTVVAAAFPPASNAPKQPPQTQSSGQTTKQASSQPASQPPVTQTASSQPVTQPINPPPASASQPPASQTSPATTAQASSSKAFATVPSSSTTTIAGTIQDGTPFPVTLAEDIPATVEEGRPLRFTVSDDVRVGDKIAIAKGAAVTGAIAEAVKGKVFGIGGKMTLKLIQVDGVDGHKLTLRSESRKGIYHSVDATVNRLPKPKDLAAASGTQYIAYIDGDQIVSFRK